MWGDIKRNLWECKPVLDHFIPYGMGSGLMLYTPQPVSYGLFGATILLGAYRFDAVWEKERLRIKNAILVEQQKETIEALSAEVNRLSDEIERIRKIKVFVH